MSDQTPTGPSPPEDTTPAQEIKKTEQAIEAAQPLFKVKAVFPFDLFPEEILLDHHKIDVVNYYFFASKEITSIPLKEVSAITVLTSPFFATMQIANRVPMNPTLEVKYLPIDKAVKFRKIAQGLIVGMNQNIDFTKLSNDATITAAEELGDTKIETIW